MSDEEKKVSDDLIEFEENPYDHQNKRPEDVVRLFYLHDVPVIPVVSKRGILIGILSKEAVISELSDIERVEKLKIDEFITNLACSMTFEQLMPYGNIKEFIIINIFGEIKGTWQRIELFSACEGTVGIAVESEVQKQQEDQALEWVIYLILEHIPVALYAVNEKGRTIFFNSHFDDLYTEKYNSEVNIEHVEKSIKDPSCNELFSQNNDDELYFYNTELGIYYEKIPMYSSGNKAGFLIFCDRKISEEGSLKIPGVDTRGRALGEMMEAIERQIIVDSIHHSETIDQAAGTLGISKQSLKSKIKKFEIESGRG